MIFCSEPDSSLYVVLSFSFPLLLNDGFLFQRKMMRASEQPLFCSEPDYSLGVALSVSVSFLLNK